MGKKTLYLDIGLLKEIEGNLKKLPGRPTLSAFLNEMLPVLAWQVEELVKLQQASNMGQVMTTMVKMKAQADGQFAQFVQDFSEDVPPTQEEKEE